LIQHATELTCHRHPLAPTNLQPPYPVSPLPRSPLVQSLLVSIKKGKSIQSPPIVKVRLRCLLSSSLPRRRDALDLSSSMPSNLVELPLVPLLTQSMWPFSRQSAYPCALPRSRVVQLQARALLKIAASGSATPRSPCRPSASAADHGENGKLRQHRRVPLPQAEQAPNPVASPALPHRQAPPRLIVRWGRRSRLCWQASLDAGHDHRPCETTLPSLPSSD